MSSSFGSYWDSSDSASDDNSDDDSDDNSASEYDCWLERTAAEVERLGCEGYPREEVGCPDEGFETLEELLARHAVLGQPPCIECGNITFVGICCRCGWGIDGTIDEKAELLYGDHFGYGFREKTVPACCADRCQHPNTKSRNRHCEWKRIGCILSYLDEHDAEALLNHYLYGADGDDEEPMYLYGIRSHKYYNLSARYHKLSKKLGRGCGGKIPYPICAICLMEEEELPTKGVVDPDA